MGIVIEIEHHTEAIMSTNAAALSLIELLPETEFVTRIRHVLKDQFEVLECVVRGRQFGSDRLDAIIQNCEETIEQIEKMNGE